MKAILISIHPKWVELILNFIKKDEIRKGTAIGKAINKLIEEQGVAPMLIYCTKGKDLLLQMDIVDEDNINAKLEKDCDSEDLENSCNILNGKVVARFNATAEEIKIHFLNKQLTYRIASRYEYTTKSLSNSQLKKSSCLSNGEMNNYFKYVYDKNVVGTAIHIHDLEIFDKPKELSEFQGTCKSCAAIKVCKLDRNKCDKHIKKAPQNYCYVELEK